MCIYEKECGTVELDTDSNTTFIANPSAYESRSNNRPISAWNEGSRKYKRGIELKSTLDEWFHITMYEDSEIDTH